MELSEKEVKNAIPEEERWENLKISNDFMFAKVMRNPQLCKELLERMLRISIDRIEYPEEQKVIDIAKDSKSVRLDVYLKDGNGTVYNVEIQTAGRKNLPKRTRYYQGMIDLNAIEKGTDYSELPRSLVIFICTFDAFGEGRRVYTFRNVCKENNRLLLNDGTSKIFFNTTGTRGRMDRKARNILKFIENSIPEDEFTEKLAQEVQKARENREWKVEYMTLLMREREKYKEGIAQGIVQGRAGGIIDAMLSAGYANEDILAALKEKLKVDSSQAESYLKRFHEGTLYQ